jgi:hypothetical protein
MTADPEYDDKKLYEYSKKVFGIDLVCPVKRYKSTPKERLELVCFYESALGHTIYNQRGISASIEPLIEHIKSVFRIDPLSTCIWISVCICNCIIICLTISNNVYYNCKTDKSKPPKSIKYVLGTW